MPKLGCMSLANLVQLIAACVGVMGSLFFAIGVIRQNAHAMARLSSSYWDASAHMLRALASQKAEYILGGGLIVAAFALQFASFFATDTSPLLTGSAATVAPWLALAVTLVLFLIVRAASARLANHFQAQVEELMREEIEEGEHKEKEQQEAGETVA